MICFAKSAHKHLIFVLRADGLLRLKCNREKPCQNCIVRGEANAASCTYAEKTEKRGNGTPNSQSNAENMRCRLNRLESAILSMVDPSTAASESSVSPASQLNDLAPSQAGGQKISVDTRSTHWDAILNEAPTLLTSK
jgi:Fungal Zn(2)-Cys(6) binuclear cluster domain